MNVLAVISLILVVCLVVSACGQTTVDSENEEDPEFSLGMDDELNMDTEELDDLDLSELDNLL